jgi:hypothetical protein
MARRYARAAEIPVFLRPVDFEQGHPVRVDASPCVTFQTQRSSSVRHIQSGALGFRQKVSLPRSIGLANELNQICEGRELIALQRTQVEAEQSRDASGSALTHPLSVFTIEQAGRGDDLVSDGNRLASADAQIKRGRGYLQPNQPAGLISSQNFRSVLEYADGSPADALDRPMERRVFAE